jgi:hypothetical protein
VLDAVDTIRTYKRWFHAYHFATIALCLGALYAGIAAARRGSAAVATAFTISAVVVLVSASACASGTFLGSGLC